MAQLSTAQARVSDPVLTEVAQGYQNPEMVAHHLFPVVPVDQRAGKIITFGAEDFGEYSLERAPGADIPETDFGYEGGDYALVQRALEGKLPIELMEEAAAVPGIDMQMLYTGKTMDVVQFQIEVAAAKLATTTANYKADYKAVLAGSSQWDHSDSTPAQRIETAKEAVSTAIGMDPNVLLLGQPVMRALKNNPDVIDRIKHTEGLTGNAGPTVNASKLAQYFDVDMVVEAKCRKGAPGAFTSLWGKVAVLAYANVTPLASRGSPSFGYTYRLRGYPVAEPAYYRRKNRSWLFPVTTEDTPVIAGDMGAGGYLLTAVVS